MSLKTKMDGQESIQGIGLEENTDISRNGISLQGSRSTSPIRSNNEDVKKSKDENIKLNKNEQEKEQKLYYHREKDEDIKENQNEDDYSLFKSPEENSQRKGISEKLILTKFSLYESKSHFYIVGTNSNKEWYKLLIIYRAEKDNNAHGSHIHVNADSMVYTKDEIDTIIYRLNDSNKNTGGVSKPISFLGIVGIISFLHGCYLTIITKCSPVALIGGNYVYHIDDTKTIYLGEKLPKSENKVDELRYRQIFDHIDLGKNFYFSYKYDLTRTLESNLNYTKSEKSFSSMFTWNDYMLKPLSHIESHWKLKIIHGFVDQSKISVFGRMIYITLIARRSRFFAGTRYLKRGANDKGYVANEVETEQIVFNTKTSTFFSPFSSAHLYNDNYTSFVQHRGSIPLFWTQDALSMATKPPIELNLVDPFYSTAGLHFDRMFQQYGTPVIVLNLVKSKEKIPRESILLKEFTNAVNYLNQFLDKKNKIQYIAWDMARASKSRDQDVVDTLKTLADKIVNTTYFFHSGPETNYNYNQRVNNSKNKDEVITRRMTPRFQNGVVRTNCIDCLDRTNAAQFVIGKCALAHQLHALGILEEPILPFDCDAVNILNAMYHDHGDTIALQYGGSHLVNTMETYRKTNPWTSHSRDMIESIKRYYSNSFTDAEKQDAINLFLGYYKISSTPGSNHLWDLKTDYYLHNDEPHLRNPSNSYIKWYHDFKPKLKKQFDFSEIFYNEINFYSEYYQPNYLTVFDNEFVLKMMSSINGFNTDDHKIDISPFVLRRLLQESKPLMQYSLNIGGVRRWLRLPSSSDTEGKNLIQNTNLTEVVKKEVKTAPWWTMESTITRLLSPTISPEEANEYQNYIEQNNSKNIRMRNIRDDINYYKNAVNNKDLDTYISSVSLPKISIQGGELYPSNKVSSIQEEKYMKKLLKQEEDMNIYKEHASGNKTWLVQNNSDLHQEDAYSKWLNLGIYIPARRPVK